MSDRTMIMLLGGSWLAVGVALWFALDHDVPGLAAMRRRLERCRRPR